MSNFCSNKFMCTNCGKEVFPLARKNGQQREAGHLKKLYCYHCKAEHNCVEIRELFDDYNEEIFKIEFENGNFTKEGQRKLPFRQFLKEMREVYYE